MWSCGYTILNPVLIFYFVKRKMRNNFSAIGLQLIKNFTFMQLQGKIADSLSITRFIPILPSEI